MKSISKIMLIILLILLSCKQEDTNPSEFGLVIKNGLPFIRVTINDKGGMLLVDSGANRSYIDSRYTEYYDFVVYASEETADGVGGNVAIYNTSHLLVKYNDSILGHRFQSANLGATFYRTGVVGILGSDYFKKNNISIDFSNNKLHRVVNE